MIYKSPDTTCGSIRGILNDGENIMKINGVKIEGPNVEIIVIPRGGDIKDIVFMAQAIIDYEEYDKKYPAPNAPEIIKPGGIKYPDYKDTDFAKQFDDWANQKADWQILKSLEATPNLEWETIDMDKPETWGNYKDELKAASFSAPEIVRIENGVTAACGLDQKKIDEAKERFLVGREAALKEQSSLSLGQKSMPSGKPASDSE